MWKTVCELYLSHVLIITLLCMSLSPELGCIQDLQSLETDCSAFRVRQGHYEQSIPGMPGPLLLFSTQAHGRALSSVSILVLKCTAISTVQEALPRCACYHSSKCRPPAQGVTYLHCLQKRTAWMTGQAEPTGMMISASWPVVVPAKAARLLDHSHTTELAMTTSSALISWQWTLKHMEVIVLNIFNKSL